MADKISELPLATIVTLTDEFALNQSGITRRAPASLVTSAIESGIDHTAILNIGTNSHAQLDTHLLNVSNPHVVTQTQVGLSNVQNTKVNFSAVIPPTVANDNTEGYSVGSVWIDVALNKAYTCVDSSTGAAIWSWINSISESHLTTAPGNMVASVNAPYASASVFTNGSAYYSDHIPDDFMSIVSATVYCIPASTAATLDIDILLNYGTSGELFNANTATETTATYDFVANTIFGFDVTSLFGGVVAEDNFGLSFTHNAIGQTVQYLPMHISYSRF